MGCGCTLYNLLYYKNHKYYTIMFIKNIKLQNYRNYDRLNGNDGLDFGKKATLLIGKNGAGKTNMIHADRKSTRLNSSHA